MSKKKALKPIILGLIIAIPIIFSYPFLSRDFFNYMFDAKIATFYHQNPYLFKALDFPSDTWLRFMHWTHRTYPYGPTFLAITLVPSVLSLGKLILSLLFFKLTWILFYLTTIFVLNKKYRNFAIYFATSPLIIIEGLINNHNDLIAVCLTIIGMAFIFQKEKIKGYLFLLISSGIKYFTLPYLFVFDRNKKNYYLTLFFISAGFVYIGLRHGIQPWYLINFMPLLLLKDKCRELFTVASAGLLLSYYPYIAIGDWTNEKVILYKNTITLATLLFVSSFYLINKIKTYKSS